MEKQVLQILINNLKKQAVDTVINALVQSLAEYRRSVNEGNLDVSRTSPTANYEKQGSFNPEPPKAQESFISKLFKF